VKNRAFIMGLHSMAAIGLLTPMPVESGADDEEIISIREDRPLPKRSIEIIADEPEPAPRHSGTREAARRLRQMAKRAA